MRGKEIHYGAEVKDQYGHWELVQSTWFAYKAGARTAARAYIAGHKDQVVDQRIVKKTTTYEKVK